jgi:thiol-disulfide isomerase/thioredoxin
MSARAAQTPTCSYFYVVLAGLAVLAGSGCPGGSAKLPPASVPGSNLSSSADESQKPGQTTTAAKDDGGDIDPAKLLAEMAATYKQAQSYQDAGELRITVETEGGDKQASPVYPFSVAFERPNKIRIHSLQASVVADGKLLRASAESLEGQVLVVPCPEKLTSASLESDTMLVETMRGEIDLAMPQLPLLLDDDAIQRIAGDGAPTLLAAQEFGGESCHRVSIKGRNGTSVFWISPKSRLLVKFEFPADAFKQQHSLAAAAITAEFPGATVDAPIAADAFRFDVPEGAKLLKRFLPPPPEAPSSLLAQKPGAFEFVDYRGGTVTPASLGGKVVVLDMWATWCGWCFEGFPNLQKVYDQFKGNDKVAILAVNTDDVTVSDEKVRESFDKAKLTIPIVRDTKQAAEGAFKVQGLPTMVVLGADGSIQAYHIGYDPKLAETLPVQINRLLAGENLAQEELDKYQKAVKEYQQQEADALVAGTDDGKVE